MEEPVDEEEGDNLRKMLDSHGASGFGDVVNRVLSRKQSAPNRISLYMHEFSHAAENKGQSNYSDDLVLAYFVVPQKVECVSKLVKTFWANIFMLCQSSVFLEKKRTIGRSGGKSKFVDACSNAFDLAKQALASLDSWAAMFFAHTVMYEIPFKKSDLEKIRSLAASYVDGEPRDTEQRHTAYTMLLYLNFHEIDPAGVFVGRKVKNSFCDHIKWTEQPFLCAPLPVTSLVYPWDASEKNSSAGRKETGGLKRFLKSKKESLENATSPRPAGTGMVKRESGNMTTCLPAEELSVPKLLERISLWSELKSDKKIADAVREFMSDMHRSLLNVKAGDLVLVNFRTAASSEDNLRFGRFICFVDNNKSVAVFMDGMEEGAWRVPIDLVSALPPGILNVICDDHEDPNVEKWKAKLAGVVDESETAALVRFEMVAENYMRKCLSDMATSYNMDISKFTGGGELEPFEIADIPVVHQLIRLVRDLQSSTFWVLKFKQLLEDHAGQTMEDLNQKELFILERKRLIIDLQSKPENAARLFESELKKFRTNIEERLRGLAPAVEHVKSGMRKRELVSWWLDLTREKVMKYLHEKGYDENVVTRDYINDPPLNFKGVKKNLELVRATLDDINGARKEEGLWPIIAQLKEEVYGKIDEYISDCEIVLSDVFSITLDSFSLETGKKLLETRKSSFSPGKYSQLFQLLDDMDYLKQMKELEDCKEKRSMHIVPVSGLCISRVVRLEQEMRTVCEVWQDHDKSAATTDDLSDEYDGSSIVVVEEENYVAMKDLVKKLQTQQNI